VGRGPLPLVYHNHNGIVGAGLSTDGNVPCDVDIKNPHYDHTARAHRHTVPGRLLPPVRLGRRQGSFVFAPEGRVGARERPWMTELRLVSTGPLGVLTSSMQGIFHLVGTTLWELNQLPPLPHSFLL
jgi:hypothetical protein